MVLVAPGPACHQANTHFSRYTGKTLSCMCSPLFMTNQNVIQSVAMVIQRIKYRHDGATRIAENASLRPDAPRSASMLPRLLLYLSFYYWIMEFHLICQFSVNRSVSLPPLSAELTMLAYAFSALRNFRGRVSPVSSGGLSQFLIRELDVDSSGPGISISMMSPSCNLTDITSGSRFGRNMSDTQS